MANSQNEDLRPPSRRNPEDRIHGTNGCQCLCARQGTALPRNLRGRARRERAISADTALRLGRYFGLPAQFWLNLQNDYDLRIASRNGAAERIKPRAHSESLASAAR
jgi:hypothetical protein